MNLIYAWPRFSVSSQMLQALSKNVKITGRIRLKCVRHVPGHVGYVLIKSIFQVTKCVGWGYTSYNEIVAQFYYSEMLVILCAVIAP